MTGFRFNPENSLLTVNDSDYLIKDAFWFSESTVVMVVLETLFFVILFD